MSKKRIKKIFYFICLLFANAVVYNLLFVPVDLITGGTGSIAILINYLFKVEPSVSIFIMYAILFVVALVTLKKDDIIAAAVCTIIYPVFVSLTSNITNIIVIEVDNTLLIAIISGVLYGIISGFMYKIDMNPGGIGLLSKIIYKYYNISVTKINTIINSIIILAGATIFGVNMILYALVYLYFTKLASDRIIIGISKNKIFHVLTTKANEIKNVVSEEFMTDCTIYNTNNKDKKFMMIVVSNKDYYLIKEVIKKIDKKAFSFISDGYETKGQNIMIRS